MAARKKASVPAKKPKAKTKLTGPEIITKMQATPTLDRFFDRNPWKGDITAYTKATIKRLRAERILYIAKDNSK